MDQIQKNIIKNATGVDFSDSSDVVDHNLAKLIQANFNDPIVMAKYICKENPNIVKVAAGAEDNGSFYKYNGKHYDLLTKSNFKKIIYNFCVKYGVTKAFKSYSIILEALMVSDEITEVEKMNPFDNMICVDNGVLDIYTKEFFPHDPKYFFDYALVVKYDPDNLSCPVFEHFLDDVLSGETETIENMIMLGGYLLDTSCRADRCFFFDGNGGSGKSTLINVFTMFFPARTTRPVVTSLSLGDLADNSFNSADLIYSRFNQCAETKKGYYDAEFLKKMVSGDLITVRGIYKEPITFRYQGKVVLVGNGLPRFNDTSDGIYRRIIIVNFKKQYKHPEEIAKIKYANQRNIHPIDTDLFDKLKAEDSAILNLFIDGLLKLKERKYKFHFALSSEIAMDEFRRDSDTARDFLEENYTIDFDNTVPLAQIFNDYRAWYMANVQDVKSMKFRSAEMAKRIKEVFGLDSCGRIRFFNEYSKQHERLTAYNLRKIDKNADDTVVDIIDGKLVEVSPPDTDDELKQLKLGE